MEGKKSLFFATGYMVLLLLEGTYGLASHRMMSIQNKISKNHPQNNNVVLISSPLSYAIDSTRMGTNMRPSMPQNMTLPVILSDEDMLPSIQSSFGSDARTRSNILKSAWRKMRCAMKVDRQAIAKMGIDFGLTYNMISNINGSVTLSAAWYIASMKVRRKNIDTPSQIIGDMKKIRSLFHFVHPSVFFQHKQ